MTHLLDSFTDVQDSKNLNSHKSGDDYFIPVLHIPAEMAPHPPPTVHAWKSAHFDWEPFLILTEVLLTLCSTKSHEKW